MKAINNFDVHYGVQFSTYAVPIIMGEIKRYFRDDGTIKVSRSLKELNIKINKAKEKLITLYGYEPTVQEIAKELEVDVMDVVEAIDASYYPTSLSEPIYEKDGSTISMEERIEDSKILSEQLGSDHCPAQMPGILTGSFVSQTYSVTERKTYFIYEISAGFQSRKSGAKIKYFSSTSI